MGLASLSVKRPVAISMVFLGIALVGVVSLARLPVELMPNISYGDITIFVEVRGGIPSSEIEARVSRPIEEAVGTVTHIKNILSISKEGMSTVVLEFEPGTNMDFAALEVRENLARIKNKLPPEIEKPVIAQYEYMDVPIMILAITSDNYTSEEMRRIVDDRIKERIGRVEGVAKVEVAGGRERKILVEVDQRRLQAYRLPIGRVVDILNLNNVNLLAGDIERVKDKHIIRAMGEFRSLSDIENMGIASTPIGSIIRLKDVAEVKDSYLEPTGFARMNVRPVVSLYILKESMANTVKVAEGVIQELEKIQPQLDESIRITPTFNQANFVKKAINTVRTALSYGAVLAVLVLFVFLRDLRPTFIIALTIPLSVLFTFSLMFLGKINLNVMTLSGLALGIGMLVDNSIVVLENIFHKRESSVASRRSPVISFQSSVKVGNQGPETGDRREETAISGAREVTLAIIASTITTVVVFLPIVFVNKEIQMLYSGLALTVTFSLLTSLFVALTLVPMLAAKMGKARTQLFPIPAFSIFSAFLSFISKGKERIRGFFSMKQRFRKPFFSRVQEGYIKGLRLVIRFRYLAVLVALFIFAGAILLSTRLEREFIGMAEQNKFTIFIELPTGARLEVSDEIVIRVEELLKEMPEIKTATARVEPWSSKIYVELLPLAQRRRSSEEIINLLRPQVEKIQPAFIYFEESQEVGTKEIILELYGYDYELLKEMAIAVAGRLDGIERLSDVKIRMREGRPEMQLYIDKQKAALFGLSVEEIAGVVHAQMRGLVATRYHPTIEPLVRLKPQTEADGGGTRSGEEKTVIDRKMQDFMATHMASGEGKEVESIVRLEEKFRRTFGDLHKLTLNTPEGDPVYLEQVTGFRFDLGPSEIWRKNKNRMVQVSANTGGIPLGTAAEKIKQALLDVEFPEDYFWRFGGNYDKMQRNQKELTFALWFTLILVFMVLASLFESYYQPFIVMISVPLALIGVVTALSLTKKPIGIGVLIGGIMLAGIVVNNAIILLDRINRLKMSRASGLGAPGETGYSLLRPVIVACRDRLRPILMTSFTTVLGLLPMALDKSESANLWSPLAITVIGGMVSSTPLTLFIAPSIYLIFEDARKKLGSIFIRRNN